MLARGGLLFDLRQERLVSGLQTRAAGHGQRFVLSRNAAIFFGQQLWPRRACLQGLLKRAMPRSFQFVGPVFRIELDALDFLRMPRIGSLEGSVVNAMRGLQGLIDLRCE